MSDTDPQPGNGATIRYRVAELEREIERQRDRAHTLSSEQAAIRLLIQKLTDQLDHLDGDVTALKRAFYTFAFAVVGSSIVFAFTVFALLGKR